MPLTFPRHTNLREFGVGFVKFGNKATTNALTKLDRK